MTQQKKTKVGKIDKKMMLGEIVQNFPKAAKYLTERHGIHCMGCPMAASETLEEGLAVHGFSRREIANIVEEMIAEESQTV